MADLSVLKMHPLYHLQPRRMLAAEEGKEIIEKIKKTDIRNGHVQHSSSAPNDNNWEILCTFRFMGFGRWSWSKL